MRRKPARFSADDLRFMRLALKLAERGRGSTRPNPIVGAVIVRGGRVLATGFHRRVGQPHAEIEALAKLGLRAPGATLYVTLEPCCHTGRTGPCAPAIIAAGVRRVVVGCQDPNPLVDGRGLRQLARAGIAVDVGCLEEACQRQNRGFFRWIRDRRPHVTVKAAATLDGVIAPRPGSAPTGRVHFITGSEARRRAHELRAEHDGVLVGAGTVLADDPLLTVRLGRRHTTSRAPAKLGRPTAFRFANTPQPLRIVLDGRLRTPPAARVLAIEGVAPPVIIAAAPADLPPGERRAFARRARALERAGAEVVALAGPRGRVPVPRLLRWLARRGIQSLLVEGGRDVFTAFVAARVVDEVALFFAPRLQGGGVALAAGGGGLPWSRPLLLGPLGVERLGGDILLRADVVARN